MFDVQPKSMINEMTAEEIRTQTERRAEPSGRPDGLSRPDAFERGASHDLIHLWRK